MVDNFVPGDIAITSFKLSSPRGSLDLGYAFSSASIFETIFHPGTIAYIKVLDMDDQIGQLKIVGDETVDLQIQMPDGTSSEFKFALYTLEDANMATQSLNSKMYTLKCVSEEALHAKTNFVQKSYKGLLSDAIKDIHKNYLKSTKPITVENTKGNQNIVIPHHDPFKAIEMLRKRSISDQNKSSLYVYFETRDKGKQSYTFSTIEKLFKSSPVKTFTQSDSINSSIYNKPEDNIISLEIPKVFNTVDRIKFGGTRRVSQFEYRTQSYVQKDIVTDSTKYTTGGKGSYDSSSFRQKYLTSKIPPQSLIPADTSQRANTHIPDNTADLQSYLSTLLQNSLKMRVYGNFNLTPGSVIKINLPKKIGTTGPREDDEMLDGNFLISRIHHDIGMLGERPRYTCVVECIKGNLENGVK